MDMESLFGPMHYFNIAVSSVGIVSNILVMVVGLREKLRKLSFTIQLFVLSLSDLGYLVFSAFISLSRLFDLRWPFGLCPVFHWLNLGLRLISSWTIVWITIERAVGVCYPLKAKRLCSRTKSYIRAFITALTPLLATSYIFFLGLENRRSIIACINWNTENSGIKMHCQKFTLLQSLLSLLLYAIIPALAIIVTNVTICVIIGQRHNVPIWHYVQRNIRNGESHRIIGMLIINVFCFAVLTLPSDIVSLYEIYYEDTITAWPTMNMVETLTFVMKTIHHCINPIIYSLAGSSYREELYRLFCTKPCRSMSPLDKYNSTIGGFSGAHTMGNSHGRRSSCNQLDLGEDSIKTVPHTGPSEEELKRGDQPGRNKRYSDIVVLL